MSDKTETRLKQLSEDVALIRGDYDDRRTKCSRYTFHDPIKIDLVVGYFPYPRPYAENIESAQMLLEELRREGALLRIAPAKDGWLIHTYFRKPAGSFKIHAAPTLSEAVCLAYIEYVEYENSVIAKEELS